MYALFRLSTLKVLFAISLILGIHAHNYLTVPVSRANQAATQTGCRYGNSARDVEGRAAPMCAGPCDRTISQGTRTPIAVQRGQTLQIQWNRHTHPGGFIRFAWSPTSQSDSHASFDQRVDHIVCKDVGGCGPASASDPSGASNGKDCATTVTVPTYLTNGAWTLQWAYFGGWYNAGDYYACVDYTITGGPTGSQPTPYFKGGDVTYPKENVCLFYSTNALHVCTVEPCNNGTFKPGPQKGAALGYGGPIPSTTGVIKVTTGKFNPLPITTKAKTPTPQTSTSSSSSTGSGDFCYLPGTPNLNGVINANPPTCGKNSPNARCADGQCCSKYGYCGPMKDANGNYVESGTVITADRAFYLYCNGSSADYRKVPCASQSSSTSGQAVTPVPVSTSTGSDSACTTGNMRCTSDTTYSICDHSKWAADQSCGGGLVCEQSGIYIYCVRPQLLIKREMSAASTNAAVVNFSAWIPLVSAILAVLALM